MKDSFDSSHRNDGRPDPEDILRVIGLEEDKKSQGRLRIFLGMSAGVGKTYAMLKAAHQKINEGIDVVVGIVETHQRKETVVLTEGLPVVPLVSVEYRGTKIEEMDLSGILKRKPSLVIVDELAHTNAPGSRHEKRYQDVLEILDAGIDVFTAFNVQHLESRKEAVEGITGIVIRETIPDRILDVATQIELVDIAPSELLKRLSEGKVYAGDKAQRAAQNFFKEDKLTALREIALRMTAERVDQDLQKLINIRSLKNPWQTNERLLVAFSHSPYSERLIRATRRLAYNLEAPWIALHVDTGLTLNDSDQEQLVKNLNLAKELNAELITTTEINVPSAVRRICRQKNVTQVVVGRPTRRWFRDIIEGGSLLEKLVSEISEVDVHIIRNDGPKLDRPKLLDEISYYRSKTSSKKYLLMLGLIFGVILLGLSLEPWLGYRSVGFIFLLGVIIIGMIGPMGAVFLGASISAVIWDYFFIPPRFTFAITNSEDVLMCLSFFVVSVITGFLTHRIRFHEHIIREREERTNVLYQILQDISMATEKSEFLSKVTQRAGSLLESECGVILKTVDGHLNFQDQNSYSIELDEKDRAVAQWCFEKNKPAGWSTDTLSESSSLYLPLKGTKEVVGIFIFRPLRRSRKMDLDKENLLLSIVRQLGVSVERHFLIKRLAEAQRLEDSEKLHQTLLNSISHEIRTPLTAIVGAVSALENPDNILNKKYVHEVTQGLHEASDRLNRVIENLLDMSRLSSGVLSLNLEWHDMNDLLGVVVGKLQRPLAKHNLKIHFLEKLVLIKIDFRLMEHAISNIILNAAMYTPAQSQIEMTMKCEGSWFHLMIQDNGPGIPESARDKIFDKFYRVPGSPAGGTGLGLSIVKSIVELHQGQVKATQVFPHGVCFTISLPLGEQPVEPPEPLIGKDE